MLKCHPPTRPEGKAGTGRVSNPNKEPAKATVIDQEEILGETCQVPGGIPA
ncbi:MAG: hypothetical protein R2830_05870 [Saprospiraceae bacterium]